MSDLKLTFDTRDLIKGLENVGEDTVNEAIRQGLLAGAVFLVGIIKLNIQRNGLIDKGNLLNSVTWESPRVAQMSFIEFGPHTVYAAIHEFGGIIHPTNSKYLTIPMNGTKLRARDYTNGELHFVKIEGSSSALLVDKSGVARFFLTKSVHMPARPYVRPALDEHGDYAMNVMARTIEGILGDAWSK